MYFSTFCLIYLIYFALFVYSCNPGYREVCDIYWAFGCKSTTCIPCSAGYYCPNGVELMCPKSKYCPIGSSVPSECPLGTDSSSGAKALSDCVKCLIGSYRNKTDMSYCENCPLGYSCPEGTINPKICPEGTFSSIKTSTCEDCNNYILQFSKESAFYNDKPGQFSCNICDMGYYCPDSKTKKICPQNTFSLGGQRKCSKCSCGTVAKSEGSSFCLPCQLLNMKCQEDASNIETVATTIIKEAGYNKNKIEYDAIAWTIYNRMQSPTGCGFSSNPKDNVLLKNQYEVNKKFYGAECMPKSEVYLKNGVEDMFKVTSFQADLTYARQLATNLEMGLKPTPTDPTGNLVFFLANSKAVRDANPDGFAIGGNWFFDTKGSIGCGRIKG